MNGSGSFIGYKVEVRCNKDTFDHAHPLVLQDGIVTPEWREVQFISGVNPAGVPELETFALQSHAHNNLLPKESAIALAWTIIAQQGWRYLLECRLVEYEVKYEYSVTKKSPIEEFIISIETCRMVKRKADKLEGSSQEVE